MKPSSPVPPTHTTPPLPERPPTYIYVILRKGWNWAFFLQKLEGYQNLVHCICINKVPIFIVFQKILGPQKLRRLCPK
jgi:hypothetical protein